MKSTDYKMIAKDKSKGNPCDKPTYKTRKEAVRHGYITYGKTNKKRKFQTYKVKGGWNVRKVI